MAEKVGVNVVGDIIGSAVFGTLCETANYQVAVSLDHVGAEGRAVLDWRLYLQKNWTQDGERMRVSPTR